MPVGERSLRMDPTGEPYCRMDRCEIPSRALSVTSPGDSLLVGTTRPCTGFEALRKPLLYLDTQPLESRRLRRLELSLLGARCTETAVNWTAEIESVAWLAEVALELVARVALLDDQKR